MGAFWHSGAAVNFVLPVASKELPRLADVCLTRQYQAREADLPRGCVLVNKGVPEHRSMSEDVVTSPSLESIRDLPENVRTAISAGYEPGAGPPVIGLAAELLASWGLIEEASALLTRTGVADLPLSPVFRARRVISFLRKSKLIEELSALVSLGKAPNQILQGRHDSLFYERPKATKLLIVLPGGGEHFFISLNVLWAYLRRLPISTVFLRDTEDLLFLNGVKSLGGSYHATVRRLRRLRDELGQPELYIMGSSAGGFGGLIYALNLKARAFLGLSIHTDLSLTSALPRMKYFAREDLIARIPTFMIDTYPLVEAQQGAMRIKLIYSEGQNIDRLQALHLKGLPNVDVEAVPGKIHDVASILLSQGRFMAVLREFLELPLETINSGPAD